MEIVQWVELEINLQERFQIDITKFIEIIERIDLHLTYQSRIRDVFERADEVLNAEKELKTLLSMFIGLFVDCLKEKEKEKFNDNYAVCLRLLKDTKDETIGEKEIPPPGLITDLANEVESNVDRIRIILTNAEQSSSNKVEFLKNVYKFCYADIGIFGNWIRVKGVGFKIKGEKEKLGGIEIKRQSKEPFDEKALEDLRESDMGFEE